jgi:hypothetical protein
MHRESTYLCPLIESVRVSLINLDMHLDRNNKRKDASINNP